MNHKSVEARKIQLYPFLVKKFYEMICLCKTHVMTVTSTFLRHSRLGIFNKNNGMSSFKQNKTWNKSMTKLEAVIRAGQSISMCLQKYCYSNNVRNMI